MALTRAMNMFQNNRGRLVLRKWMYTDSEMSFFTERIYAIVHFKEVRSFFSYSSADCSLCRCNDIPEICKTFPDITISSEHSHNLSKALNLQSNQVKRTPRVH